MNNLSLYLKKIFANTFEKPKVEIKGNKCICCLLCLRYVMPLLVVLSLQLKYLTINFNIIKISIVNSKLLFTLNANL